MAFLDQVSFQPPWGLNMALPIVLASIVILVIIDRIPSGPDLSGIPSFGPTGRLTSFIGCYFFMKDTPGVLQDQIDKYKHQGGAFRVPFLDHWQVVISGKKYIDEIAQARDDDLSANDPIAEVLQTEFTMGPSIKYDRYHISVISSTLTRNLVARYDDIYDEVASSCENAIRVLGSKPDAKGWVSVPTFEAVTDIVARTSSRLFVGLPLCRSTSYLTLAKSWAVQVLIGGFFINFMPWIVKPIFQQLAVFRRRYSRHPGRRELKKYVMERVQLDRELGVDRPDRPNDSISWFYDVAIKHYPADHIADDLVERIMFLNFAAIHTTSSALTSILFHLAEHPEKYLEPLRKEVKEVVGKHGWTKAALRYMIKIDSFVRESERMNGLGSLILTRQVVNPNGFTFSNGVHLPMGAILSAPNFATHHTDEYYPNANTFDGFRWSDIREEAEDYNDLIRNQFVRTTPEYIVFGHGRHGCPGRFFAGTELKTVLAYIVLHYDVKLSDACNGVKPPNSWMSIALIPDKHAHICLRKRNDVELDF